MTVTAERTTTGAAVPEATAERIWLGLSASSREVELCERQHGHHRWIEMLVEARKDYVVEICARCYVRRCDAYVDLETPTMSDLCVWATGHIRPHRDARGYWRPVS